MGNTTFSGPVRAGSRQVTSTLGNANVGYAVMGQGGLVNFAATGSTTTVATLPANSQIIDIHVDIVTAFNAGTTNQFDIGDGSTANLFADNLNVGTVGKVLGSSDASQIPNYDDIGTTDVDIVVTYNQTGGAATAGQAAVTVLYLQDRNLQA